MSVLDQILEHKIVAIVRGIDPKHIVPIANALYEGGVKLMEVTLNSENAFAQIEQLSSEFENKMIIGAGTVLEKKEAKEAIKAGAKFLISPNVNPKIIKYANENDVVSIPGAYTPTEVYQAYASGGDIVKIFPITSPDYLKSLIAPLNKIRMMPTGGVNVNNIKDFKKAGAVAFGIGSALVQNTSSIDDGYLNNLTERARTIVQAISEDQ